MIQNKDCKLSTENSAADAAKKTDDKTESRPAVQARDNAATGKGGRNMLSYTNRDGQQVSIPVTNIQTVDEIVPSGTWDVEQREKDDVIGLPIVILDAINMTGQQNPFVVCLVIEANAKGEPKMDTDPFSIAYSGVPYTKIRRAMGFDEDGRDLGGGRSRLPMACKTEKIQPTTGGNWYWDLKAPNWSASAVAVS